MVGYLVDAIAATVVCGPPVRLCTCAVVIKNMRHKKGHLDLSQKYLQHTRDIMQFRTLIVLALAATASAFMPSAAPRAMRR